MIWLDFLNVLRYLYLGNAPIAQLDRVAAYEAEGCRFNSCWARHGFLRSLSTETPLSCDEPIMVPGDEVFMAEALKEARTALDEGEVPVGAVIVQGQRVVARAHNQRETLNDPTAHAEMIALTQASAAAGRWRLTDMTMYVTLEPCAMCAGALVLARIGRLVFGTRDPKTGACGSLYNIVRDGRLNHTVEITEGVCELEASQILRDFFQKRRVPYLHD